MVYNLLFICRFVVVGKSLFPFDDAKVIRFSASRQTLCEVPAEEPRTHPPISDKQQKPPRFLSETGAVRVLFKQKARSCLVKNTEFLAFPLFFY